MSLIEVPTEIEWLTSTVALGGAAIAIFHKRDALTTVVRTPPNLVQASRITRRARRLIASSPEVWQQIAASPPRLRHNWSFIDPHESSEGKVSVRTPNLRQTVLYKWSGVEFVKRLHPYMPHATRLAVTDFLFQEFWRQLTREKLTLAPNAGAEMELVARFNDLKTSPNLSRPFVREIAAIAGDPTLQNRKRLRLRLERTTLQFSSGPAESFDNSSASETGCYVLGLSAFNDFVEIPERVETKWVECRDRGLRMHVVGIVHSDKVRPIVDGLQDRVSRWEQHARDLEVSELVGHRSALSFSFVPT